MTQSKPWNRNCETNGTLYTYTRSFAHFMQVQPIRVHHFKDVLFFNVLDAIFYAVVPDNMLNLSQSAMRNIGKQVMFDLNIQSKTEESDNGILGFIVHAACHLVN